MPLWLLGLLLIAYIVVIGPVDYLVLGWLGVRKLTWIVFPLMTVAFTVLIVWISHEHMGTSGNVRQLIVRDIGDGGELARENRFDLHLVGSHTTLATSVTRGLFTPIDHRRFLSNGTARSADLFGSGHDSTEPSEYIGTIPVGYTALQDLPQWSPQVNRVFRIAPEEPMPALTGIRSNPRDWPPREPPGPGSRSLSSRSSGSAVRPCCFTQTRRLATLATPPASRCSPKVLGTGSRTPSDAATVAGRSPARPTEMTATHDFLRDACVRPSRGVFRAVSRVAPHGGDNFEDSPCSTPPTAASGCW
ncbi:MAG: hypothetical protein Ct9H300mP1_32080 [Planctomycetaceae bacterium]|nr:MAG: hypothetical protein Ct9H300mP1_32080 [Planctomycetaceae bacterium]